MATVAILNSGGQYKFTLDNEVYYLETKPSVVFNKIDSTVDFIITTLKGNKYINDVPIANITIGDTVITSESVLDAKMASVFINAGSSALKTKIDTYQNGGADVMIAGKPDSYIFGGSIPNIAGDPYNSGTTIINPSHAIRQNGLIKSIDIWFWYVHSSVPFEFKLFSWNGTAYQCKASQSLSAIGSGADYQIVDQLQTFTLPTPIEANEGDVPGIYLPPHFYMKGIYDNVANGSAKQAPYTKYIAGNIALNGTSTFASPGNVFSEPGSLKFAPIRCYGHRPFMVFQGDSILASGNSIPPYPNVASSWLTSQENSTVAYSTPGGSPGNINLSIPYRLSLRMPSTFTYQDFAISGSTWLGLSEALNNETGNRVARSVAANAKVYLFHCGINDVAASRNWAAVQANLDTIRAQIPAGSTVLLDEILPPKTGTIVQAAAIRAMNANYATYCATYRWDLVKCYDEFAVYSSVTGANDDLNPLYSNGDSVHLSDVGVDKLAGIIHRYI